jgi:hypothetical protein
MKLRSLWTLTAGSEESAVIYEYRRYEIAPGQARALEERWRLHAVEIMRGHGFHLQGIWEPEVGQLNHLHYLLRWDSLTEREHKIRAMDTDPRWLSALGATVPLTSRRSSELWRAAGYSPLTQAVWPDGTVD